MPIEQILVEDAIGCLRAVALNEHGRAVSLYQDLWRARGRTAKLGRVYRARVRTANRKDGGAFLELETGEDAFLRMGELFKMMIGAEVTVRVAAEARRGKLARVVDAEDAPVSGLSEMQTWQHGLVDGAAAETISVRVGDAQIAEAFDEALSPLSVLPRGGHLHVTPTPALTSIDVDTAGRDTAGRLAERALKVNVEAAAESARQLSLRGLGGLAVLDCIAPVQRRSHAGIKQAFLGAWRSIDTRKAEVLAPSPFGLLQIKLPWARTPIADVLLDERGEPTPEAIVLQGLRLLEVEARAAPMSRMTLNLPARAQTWYAENRDLLETPIDERFGARISVTESPLPYPDVTKT